MEDSKILELLSRRDESALAEISQKYGAKLKSVAQNLLGSPEDAEECVNDVLTAAWDASEIRGALLPWLLRTLRNKAISLYRKNHSQKRSYGLETLLSELGDCLPGAENPEAAFEGAELSKEIERFLNAQSVSDRALFVKRYFLGEALGTIAEAEHVKAKKLADRLYLIRKRLRTYLEKEGFDV